MVAQVEDIRVVQCYFGTEEDAKNLRDRAAAEMIRSLQHEGYGKNIRFEEPEYWRDIENLRDLWDFRAVGEKE